MTLVTFMHARADLGQILHRAVIGRISAISDDVTVLEHAVIGWLCGVLLSSNILALGKLRKAVFKAI